MNFFSLSVFQSKYFALLLRMSTRSVIRSFELETSFHSNIGPKKNDFSRSKVVRSIVKQKIDNNPKARAILFLFLYQNCAVPSYQITIPEVNNQNRCSEAHVDICYRRLELSQTLILEVLEQCCCAQARNISNRFPAD